MDSAPANGSATQRPAHSFGRGGRSPSASLGRSGGAATGAGGPACRPRAHRPNPVPTTASASTRTTPYFILETNMVRRTSSARTAGAVGPRPRLAGDAQGDGVQPVAGVRAPRHRAGLAGQDEEGGLEGVLGVLRVAQHAAAHAPDQRSVPLDQGGEGRLVTPTGE